MKFHFYFLAIVITALSSNAQTDLLKPKLAENQKQIDSIIQVMHPKLWNEISLIRTDANVLIEYYENIRGPGRASKESIQLNAEFLIKKQEEFSEDRLIIVLLHEFGHVLNSKSKGLTRVNSTFQDRVQSEYFAFNYSVEQAIIRAINGDNGPLTEVTTNLTKRSLGTNENDPHIPAIKQLMDEPIWLQANDLLKQ